jgi:hypothetical protein
MYDTEVTNEGRVTVEVLPTQPGSPASFESPSLVQRFQLNRRESGVEVKLLDTWYE